MSLRGEKREEFSQKVRKQAFARCCQACPVEGVANVPGVPQCEGCGVELRPSGFIYEHIDADGLGGDPTIENCKVHCLVCKKTKDKIDGAIMAKADRVLKKAYGLQPSKRKPMQGRAFEKAAPQRRASRPIERKTYV